MYLEGVVLIRMTKCFRVKHDGLEMRAWRLGFGVCDLRFRFWGFAGSKDMNFLCIPSPMSLVAWELTSSLPCGELSCDVFWTSRLPLLARECSTTGPHERT